MKRKGFAPLLAFNIGVAAAVALAIIFLVIFKVRITNAINYEHKTDSLGYAYNALLSFHAGGYTNTEAFGAHVLRETRDDSDTPDHIRQFRTGYFDMIINELYPGQKCISFLIRKSDLTLETESRDDECLRNHGSLIQSIAPVALPYNDDDIVKIVSLVTNR